MEFVHLSVKSKYSFEESSSEIKEILQTAKKNNMETIALTDYCNLQGAFDFYQTAKNMDIKTITGCELYISEPRDMYIKNGLILIVKSEVGYKNLLQLIYRSYKNSNNPPSINKNLLKKYNQGLIAISPAWDSDTARALLKNKGNENKTEKSVSFYKNIFGDDYYLGIYEHNNLLDNKVKDKFLKISEMFDVKIVALNKCLNTKKNSSNYYLRTTEDMKKSFKEIPKAISNTIEISEKCNFSFSYSDNLLDFPKKPYFKNYSHKEFLKTVKNKLIEREIKIDDNVQKRLKFELSNLKKEDKNYLLIIADIIEFCREKGIQIIPNGSSHCSLINFAFGITEIEPLKYGLPFERFVNPEIFTKFEIPFSIPKNKKKMLIDYTGKYN